MPDLLDLPPFHMTTGSTTISAATRRSILLLSFATFSSMVVQRICDAMLPELAREFSASLTQVAQVISVFAVAYGLSQLFYGPLGDRLGKFRVVSVATLGCSVGIAVFPDDGQDAEAILQKADEAMYQVKQNGKGGYCFAGNPGETVVVRWSKGAS